MGVPLLLGGDIPEKFDDITRAKHQCVVLEDSMDSQIRVTIPSLSMRKMLESQVQSNPSIHFTSV